MFALMPHSVGLSRRFLSTVTSATDAAVRLVQENAGKSIVRSQVIDAAQLQRLSLTLGRHNLHPGLSVLDSSPPQGTPLPAGYHLAYFTPAALESNLGVDGTDKTFNPVEPFVRRMWAGGSMTWAKDNPLRVGDVAEERTSLIGAVPKKSRSGHEMVLVEVEKAFSNKNGLALTDKRSWIFQAPNSNAPLDKSKELAGPSETTAPYVSKVEDFADHDGGKLRRSYVWSPVGLFRFSALTFNSHMIHYSNPWSTEVEGLLGLVVHGPLNLINMMDFWRDIYRKGDTSVPSKISYRAVAPLYAGEQYSISTDGIDEDGQVSIIVSREGTVNMKGKIL